jgi:hypothetical protein
MAARDTIAFIAYYEKNRQVAVTRRERVVTALLEGVLVAVFYLFPHDYRN